ncbi:MAG: DUF2867 domain-containing protein [Vicinamibacterales bacterium]
MSHREPHAIPLPRESCIEAVYGQPNLADAYAMDLPPGTTRDPEVLARFIFAHQPRWVADLMEVRDSCVSLLGLKTGRSLRSADGRRERIGIFKVYESGPLEVIVGEDDKHLDFRASVLYRAADGPAVTASIVLSTVVHCHNALGRTYLWLIAPFHRLVVQSFLRQAATIGWPRENAGSSSAPPRAGG